MKKGTAPIPPTRRSGAYTAQDSVSYVRGTERLAKASADVKFSKTKDQRTAAQSKFAQEQANLKSNRYYKAKKK